MQYVGDSDIFYADFVHNNAMYITRIHLQAEAVLTNTYMDRYLI